MDSYREDKEYILNTYKRLPLEITGGEGLYLKDSSGRTYLDFYSGIAVNALGQRHPRVMEAIRVQMESYLHLSNYFVAPSLVNLARILVENSFASKVFFSNSGTEANEAMIKLAKKYGKEKSPSKVNFIALERGFHGRTMGGMTLTGNESNKEKFAPLMPGVRHVPLNDVDALTNAVDKDTCGIVFEVLQGEAGVKVLSEEFVRAIRELAKEHDALILVDEVQTGLMRTGRLFAHEYFDLKPDAMTLAKALGGGLPLGAMLVSERLEGVLQAGDHGSTFGGNPLAGAAGKAVMEVILEEGFQENVNAMSGFLFEGLQSLRGKYPELILDVRGLGLMIGIDAGEHAMKIRDEAMERGVLLNVTNATVIRLLPALILGEKEVELLLMTLDAVLEGLKGEQDENRRTV